VRGLSRFNLRIHFRFAAAGLKTGARSLGEAIALMVCYESRDPALAGTTFARIRLSGKCPTHRHRKRARAAARGTAADPNRHHGSG